MKIPFQAKHINDNIFIENLLRWCHNVLLGKSDIMLLSRWLQWFWIVIVSTMFPLNGISVHVSRWESEWSCICVLGVLILLLSLWLCSLHCFYFLFFVYRTATFRAYRTLQGKERPKVMNGSWINFNDLYIQEGRVGIPRFNATTFVCLSQARTWIFNVVCCGLFLCSVSEGERWMFVLLILVKLFTITVLTFFS